MKPTLCGYCVELPERQRAQAAKLSRCPLCKAELGVTSAGRHFRIGADAPCRRGGLIAVLAASVACLAVVAWLALRPAPVEEPQFTLPPPPAPIAVPQPLIEVPDAPADVARAKRFAEGVRAPEPRVKPRPGTIDAAPERMDVAMVPDPVAVPPAPTPPPTSYVKPFYTFPDNERLAAAARHELTRAPEIVLALPPARPSPREATGFRKEENDPVFMKLANEQIAKLVSDIEKKNGKEPDGFVRSLLEERGDLKGLPFRLGKTCQLASDQARTLAEAAFAIRSALGRPTRTTRVPNTRVNTSEFDSPYSFWNQLANEPLGKSSANIQDQVAALALLPGLLQILGPEDPSFRTGLVGRYREWKRPEVTAALARLAVFDPDGAVRSSALHVLETRSAADYTDVLLQALRYPWAPIAQRAADAMVALERRDLIPNLLDELNAPDPSAPSEQEVKGKKVLVVRELVRINHHRNCLLCHAPANGIATRRSRSPEVPIGAVPSPAEPLPPPLSAAYYDDRDSVARVRADVTYLRQDFSVLLPVENAAPWPQLQRFDFLVRTREATPSEVKAWQQQRNRPVPLSPHRQAVMSALNRLTGIDAGPSPEAWRHAMNAARSWQAPPGRLDCRK
jgi:hypothetical protein